MKTLWKQSDRDEIVQRIARLAPDARPTWGRMTAPQMLAHMTDALRMALGDLPTRSKRLPLRYAPLKQLIVYLVPFPKNAPTARELVSRVPEAWEAERDACCALIERFGAESPSRAWPEHPAFGSLSARAWGVLGYKHFDHHLRQFGA